MRESVPPLHAVRSTRETHRRAVIPVVQSSESAGHERLLDSPAYFPAPFWSIYNQEPARRRGPFPEGC
jgi:hypothetical protein